MGIPVEQKDVKTIKVITKKLRLGPAKLAQLQQAQKDNVPAIEALANVLGVKEGEDPKTFLRSKLTAHEYEVLKKIFGFAKDGSPLAD